MGLQLASEQKRRARDLGLIPGTGDLLAVAKDALSFGPPNEWPRAFLGPEQTWSAPPAKFSEFHMRDLSDPGRLARYLVDVAVPSVPALPPAVQRLLPPVISGVIAHPTTVFEYPGRYAEEPGLDTEHWFFINGILTNKEFAELNAQCITELFLPAHHGDPEFDRWHHSRPVGVCRWQGMDALQY